MSAIVKCLEGTYHTNSFYCLDEEEFEEYIDIIQSSSCSFWEFFFVFLIVHAKIKVPS